MTGPGDILGDRWVLGAKIDAGAMGEVFRAQHQVLGHDAAVKVLLPEMARDKGAIERFLREARIAAKLRHAAIVRVEDYGVSGDGRPFLVMELLHGESLARRIARDPRMHPRKALQIVRQIGAALDAAHAAGIVHRDLKPENVFLCDPADPPQVKVLDFGVAKFTDALAEGGGATASNTLVGTPRYMSPEQARASRTLDGRSDLWALGILAYEMLTGTHPFEGEAIAELLVAILTHVIAPPTALRPALPVAVDGWAARALARNRADRFATGAALADAFADALGDSTAEAWTDASAPSPRGPRDGRGTLRVDRARTAPAHAAESFEGDAAPRSEAAPATASPPPANPTITGRRLPLPEDPDDAPAPAPSPSGRASRPTTPHPSVDVEGGASPDRAGPGSAPPRGLRRGRTVALLVVAAAAVVALRVAMRGTPAATARRVNSPTAPVPAVVVQPSPPPSPSPMRPVAQPASPVLPVPAATTPPRGVDAVVHPHPGVVRRRTPRTGAPAAPVGDGTRPGPTVYDPDGI